MDVNDPKWDAFEEAFEELADMATEVKWPAPPLDSCKYYLCLFGENGLSPDDEFKMLEQMEDDLETLEKVSVSKSYWEDTILFVR